MADKFYCSTLKETEGLRLKGYEYTFGGLTLWFEGEDGQRKKIRIVATPGSEKSLEVTDG